MWLTDKDSHLPNKGYTMMSKKLRAWKGLQESFHIFAWFIFVLINVLLTSKTNFRKPSQVLLKKEIPLCALCLRLTQDSHQNPICPCDDAGQWWHAYPAALKAHSIPALCDVTWFNREFCSQKDPQRLSWLSQGGSSPHWSRPLWGCGFSWSSPGRLQNWRSPQLCSTKCPHAHCLVPGWGIPPPCHASLPAGRMMDIAESYF